VVAGRESPRLVRVAAGGGGAGEFEARRWGSGVWQRRQGRCGDGGRWQLGHGILGAWCDWLDHA
jgi:hypothetical protein